MALATFNAIALPIEISFEPETMQSWYFQAINVIVDIFFFLDIVIIFRTAIVGVEEMELIVDTKQIAVRYLKGTFWIDFLSTVPLDTMMRIFMKKERAMKFKLFALLKLIRVVRLQRLIGSLNAERKVKSMLKIVKLMFFLMLYIHIQGCLWYFIVKQDEQWIPGLQVIKTDRTPNYIWTMPLFYRYWISIYTSLL